MTNTDKTAGMTSMRTPFPRDVAQFETDPRIVFNGEEDNWHLDDEDGEKWEWSAERGAWQTRVSIASSTSFSIDSTTV